MVSTAAYLKRLTDRMTEGLSGRESILFLCLLCSAAFVPVSVAVSQITLGLAACLWLWQVGITRQWAMPRLPFGIPLTFCFLTTLIAVLASPNPLVSASSLKKFSLFLIPYLVVVSVKSEGQIRWLIRVMFIAGALSAALTFWQYPGSDPLHRVTGFLGHWQTFSGQQMMLLAVLTALLLFYREKPKLLAICLALSAIGLLLSETRGAWIGAGVAISWLVFVKDSRLLALLGMVVIAGYFLLPRHFQTRFESILDMQVESNAARLNMWSTGIHMIRAHPWLGVGPNQITALAYEYGGNPRYKPRFFTHLHNNFLQFAAERGLPGLAAWVWLLVRFFIDLIRQVRRFSDRKSSLGYSIGLGVAAALGALVVAGMVEFNLGDSEVLMMLLFLLACSYAVDLQQQPLPIPRGVPR